MRSGYISGRSSFRSSLGPTEAIGEFIETAVAVCSAVHTRTLPLSTPARSASPTVEEVFATEVLDDCSLDVAIKGLAASIEVSF